MGFNSADVGEGLFNAKRGTLRVLCIQPHYDDNDIFAGGTLTLLHDLGVELIYLTITDDKVGVLDQSLTDAQMEKQLRSEQIQAGRCIGVDRQLWLDYPDAGLCDYHRLRTDIIACLRSVQPDFIFTVDPWLPYEAHRDHVLTGQAAAEAALLVNFPRIKTLPEIDKAYRRHEIQGVVFYNTASPNLVVDITGTFERKHQSIRAYRAQFSEEELEKLIQECEVNERSAGEENNRTRVEKLKLVHPSQLHCNTEIWKPQV